MKLSYCMLPLFIRYHAHDDDRLGLNLTYASNAPSPYLTPRSKTLNGGTYICVELCTYTHISH